MGKVFINPNLHIILIHYPLALFGMGMLIEIFSFLYRRSTVRAAGRWMILIGAFATIPTAYSGVYALNDLATRSQPDGHRPANWKQAALTAMMHDGTSGSNQLAVSPSRRDVDNIWALFTRHAWLQGIASGLVAVTAVLALGASDRIRRRLYLVFMLSFLCGIVLMSWGAWAAGEAVYQYGSATRLAGAIAPSTASPPASLAASPSPQLALSAVTASAFLPASEPHRSVLTPSYHALSTALLLSGPTDAATVPSTEPSGPAPATEPAAPAPTTAPALAAATEPAAPATAPTVAATIKAPTAPATLPGTAAADQPGNPATMPAVVATPAPPVAPATEPVVAPAPPAIAVTEPSPSTMPTAAITTPSVTAPPVTLVPPTPPATSSEGGTPAGPLTITVPPSSTTTPAVIASDGRPEFIADEEPKIGSIGYFVGPPIQMHVIIAGLAVAISLGAFGATLRRFAILAEFAPVPEPVPGDPNTEAAAETVVMVPGQTVVDPQQAMSEALAATYAPGHRPTTTQDIDLIRTINPGMVVVPAPRPDPRSVPAGKLWLLAFVVALSASAIGVYFLASRLHDPREPLTASVIWQAVVSKDQNQDGPGTRRLAHVIAGGMIVVLPLVLGAMARWGRSRLFLSIIGFILALAIAAQVWLGILLLYDTNRGKVTQFNALAAPPPVTATVIT